MKVTQNPYHQKQKEVAQIKRDICPHRKPVVIFDIDKQFHRVSSISQVEASVISEAPINSKCFFEIPLVPRYLHFSESESSLNQLEEDYQDEAPNKLLLALARAFVCMVGRKARLDLQQKLIDTKNQQLNGEVRHELHVPHDICANLIIVRVFGRQLVEGSSVVAPGTIIVRNIVWKDTELCLNVAPNHSEASNLDETHEAVMEELKSSDYVSTLRDPIETLYG